MTPLVSILIVTWNSARWLPRCLESIRAQTVFDKIEVFIVDNKSSDESLAAARSLMLDWPKVQYRQTGANIGFCANNDAATLAKGEWLYFLNPDTVLSKSCIEGFLTTVREQSVPAAGGTLMEMDGYKVMARGCTGFDFTGEGIQAEPEDSLLSPAGFWFIRREYFLMLGGFDPEFFMYGEETDLAWRIHIAGGSIAYAPLAITRHAWSGPSSPCKRFLANRNKLLTIAKCAQHILLLFLLTTTAVILAEFVVTLALTLDWKRAKRSCLEPFKDVWRLRGHVAMERERIKELRVRSDWWMLRYLRLGWARSHMVKAALKSLWKQQIMKEITVC